MFKVRAQAILNPVWKDTSPDEKIYRDEYFVHSTFVTPGQFILMENFIT